MNQFEFEALRLAAGLFLLFCVAFGLRRGSRFWALLPKIVMISCLGWLICSVIVNATLQKSYSLGPLFVLAYSMVIFVTPPLLAAGVLELVLGTYTSFRSDGPIEGVPARSHFIAALSTLACILAYFVFSALPK